MSLRRLHCTESTKPNSITHCKYILLIRLDMAGDVKFGGVPCSLAITHRLAIDPDMKPGVNAFETQSQLMILESVRYSEDGDVRSTLVVMVRNVRRIHEEGKVHICILRSAETLQLPHSRHLNFTPLGAVESRAFEVGGLERTLGQVESPCSRKTECLCLANISGNGVGCGTVDKERRPSGQCIPVQN